MRAGGRGHNLLERATGMAAAEDKTALLELLLKLFRALTVGQSRRLPIILSFASYLAYTGSILHASILATSCTMV